MTFRWTNLDDAFDAAAQHVQAVALFVEERAKEVCPKATGNLARSITPADATVDRSRPTWVVGTNVYYGPFVELGTRKMAARPFLGAALSEARGRFT